MCYELENWNTSENWTLTNFQFINFILQEGYVANKQGVSLARTVFWKNYQKLIPADNLIQSVEISSVLTFDNQWNNQQYLIETPTKLSYFDWGITV